MAHTERESSALFERLQRHSAGGARYAGRKPLARGGMGEILEVEDPDLGRRLAMKLALDREGQAGDSPGSRRLLEEAQITAQLTHPGVVPVHELGLDRHGRLYFTMALVQGRDLEHVFGLARTGADGWSTTRVLGVLQRVCETMAYAHSRGVIHRDLKPANVMVGAFGEVYVMDWGLAKLAGEAESSPRTTRAAPGGEALLTQDGAIVGTPAYMSPEQARGEEIDARSDVYALGAMLYALLAGRSPYSSPNVALGAAQVVQALHKGPPAALALLAPRSAPELVAIAEKAMSRERERRYPGAAELAEDLRAYLENRVVRAHRTGAWVEFRKWVRRNRGLAAALAGGLLVLLAGALAFAFKEQERANTLLRLSGLKEVRELRAREPALWPPLPEKLADLRRWVDEADLLRAALPQHRETLAALRAKATEDGAQAGLRFAEASDAWWHETLAGLIRDLDDLGELRRRVAERRDFAAGIRERTLDSAEARARWSAARTAIARSQRHPGLDLAPQLGLLPLEADPLTGLWEFWHVQSGAEPRRGPDSRWEVTAETGIVLVLLPGATVTMGSKPGPSGDWCAPWRQEDECFLEGVELDPFFCARYECTQAQWMRVMGGNPSQHASAERLAGPTHPVETLTWHDAAEFARRTALLLPTEAQWEYACRAGTRTPFSTGSSIESLQGFANVCDAAYARGAENIGSRELTLELDDGWIVHAPVGSLEPNGFGIHDLHGNVWEWCLDDFELRPAPRRGDGLGAWGTAKGLGTMRGGAWSTPAQAARSSNRFPNLSRDTKDSDLGVRLVRRVER